MAVSALPAEPRASRAAPLPSFVFAACAALLCFSVLAIVGWLVITGLPGAGRVLEPTGPDGALAPLLATAYVTLIALPVTALMGIFAAVAAADVRIFGAASAGMRNALGIVGSVPTVVVAFAGLLAARAFGWHPTLTGAALVLAFINTPLMTGLALRALSRSADIREAAAALGASPMFIVRHVLLPGARGRLRGAIIIVATQIIGAVAAIAIITGASVHGGHGAAPIGAWPLAVHVWSRGASISGYGATAAATLLLAVMIWMFQGVGQLRAAPDGGASQEHG